MQWNLMLIAAVRNPDIVFHISRNVLHFLAVRYFSWHIIFSIIIPFVSLLTLISYQSGLITASCFYHPNLLQSLSYLIRRQRVAEVKLMTRLQAWICGKAKALYPWSKILNLHSSSTHWAVLMDICPKMWETEGSLPWKSGVCHRNK